MTKGEGTRNPVTAFNQSFPKFQCLSISKTSIILWAISKTKLSHRHAVTCSWNKTKWTSLLKSVLGDSFHHFNIWQLSHYYQTVCVVGKHYLIKREWGAVLCCAVLCCGTSDFLGVEGFPKGVTFPQTLTALTDPCLVINKLRSLWKGGWGARN